MRRNLRGCLVIVVIFSFCWQSCYRNDIGFGTLPDNNYTNVEFTDTVAPVLSTVILDSFATGGASSFLLGKYKDPYLGVISARPFFQLTVPAAVLVTIPTGAQYDSLCFVIHPNKYYYGDTSRAQTIKVYELEEAINYTYNTSIFNTSNFAVNPTPLGSRSLKVRPTIDDSILIRLDDAKGNELFNKLVLQDDEVRFDDNFQNYFKGVSIAVGDNDTTAIYGLGGTDTAMVMRVFYHTTTPYLQSQQVDFPLKSGAFSFNQLLSDRTGTPFNSSTTTGIKEYFSSQTNNLAFSQYGAGVLLKITLPSLKGIIATDKIVEVQKAQLVVRPVIGSYDPNKFKLPDDLSLVQTNGTNAIGAVVESNVPPITDEIYGLGTAYTFDVTADVTSILTTSGGLDKGYFVVQNNQALSVTRAAIGDNQQPLYKTQLLITAIVINK